MNFPQFGDVPTQLGVIAMRGFELELGFVRFGPRTLRFHRFARDYRFEPPDLRDQPGALFRVKRFTPLKLLLKFV